jgi:patatin-like phospholipase/acyl hydrolase
LILSLEPGKPLNQAQLSVINNTHSTGGIISLALAGKNWSLDEAIEQFMELCKEAFTPREFSGVLLLDHAARINHGSKYKTKPLHKALQEALGEDLLFGGVKSDLPDCDIKVAVTSTDEAGKKAIVISNYSRSSEELPNWDFHRPGDPKRELKVWQAAAATSAAAPFFKAYRNEQSGRTYFDGAFYNNNPVRVAHQERKLLWPDVANKSPDVFLSIGTGSNKQIANESERSETVQSPSRYKQNSLS